MSDVNSPLAYLSCSKLTDALTTVYPDICPFVLLSVNWIKLTHKVLMKRIAN